MTVLSHEEIIRELKRYRYDPTLGVPLKTLGDHLGIHRNSMHKYIDGSFLPSKPRREKLSRAILDIRDGRLKFVRRENVWHVEGKAVEAI